MKGDRTLAELAEKIDLHADQITQWPTRLLEGATEVFLTPAGKRDTGPSTKDVQAKIGQQAQEMEFLAGALVRIGDASAEASLSNGCGRASSTSTSISTPMKMSPKPGCGWPGISPCTTRHGPFVAGRPHTGYDILLTTD